MNCKMRTFIVKLACFSLMIVLTCFLGSLNLFGQEGAGAFANSKGKSREIAPGVMRSIQPFVNYSETYQWSSMPDILSQDRSYEWATDLFFNKEVWCLEFSFKPIRTIYVDFPTDQGRLDRVLVWYMVYSITNTGQAIKNEIDLRGDTTMNVMVGNDTDSPEVQVFEDIRNNIQGTYQPVTVNYRGQQADDSGKVPGTHRFVPQFVLTSASIMDRVKYKKDTDGFYKGQSMGPQEVIYYDTFLPIAFAKIAALEDPNQKFYTSITMPAVDIKPGETVWGIVTWCDIERQTDEMKMQSVDTRIDRFSVYISGLTNASRWEAGPEAFVPTAAPMADTTILRKVLKLNFFVPGDEFAGEGQKIHFGQPGELDYQWIYL